MERGVSRVRIADTRYKDTKIQEELCYLPVAPKTPTFNF